MSNPLLVEIIAYAPTAFYHCTHCEIAWREIGMSNQAHEEQLQSSLPEDLAQDYLVISQWVKDIFHRYCDLVVIKMVDAASFEGVWLSLRHRARCYPSIIIDKRVFAGIESLQSANTHIGGLLHTQPAV